MEPTLNYENFTGHLNTTFRVRLTDDLSLDCLLISVERRPSPPTQDIFTLLFRGPHDPRLLQHVFTVEHEVMGNFPLFLVPVGIDEHGLLYEAVFNRIVQKEGENS